MNDLTVENENSLDEQTREVINNIFKRFSTIFPAFYATFKDQERLNATKRDWLQAFMIAKFHKLEQIELGIQKCLLSGRDFLPSIGEFIAWCTLTNDDMGVPPLDVAYDEACKNSHPTSDKAWTHKLVQHAWKLTGNYFLSTSPRSVSYPVFQRNYEITIRDWRAGKKIEEIQPAKAITENKEFKKNDDLAKKSLSLCMDILKGTIKSNSIG